MEGGGRKPFGAPGKATLEVGIRSVRAEFCCPGIYNHVYAYGGSLLTSKSVPNL